ncbi:DUF1684 domain-containing protein [Corynebacterium halotolerans]|uniref:DUF1684 domain-containing protein n=1 Tax=Corynebacterium halotolerans YIM 70093 = DSM 44683 TaxID=1121362 RepID=M1NXM2_9CORY|nr:DUF1684 domain-containing protein [Corynebacterium halotolerans]AGF72250.1 hypothetical protein A605_06220 [Corynebacterium halotolerans YIM 70093 = DSM 44683]
MATENTESAESTGFAAEWESWHATHEKGVGAPFGPLSPVGMAWLDETPVRVNGAPGRWSWRDGRVVLELAVGENPVLDGRELNPRGGDTTVSLPEVTAVGYLIGDGDHRIEVALRGSRPIVRPRHPRNPSVTGYRGTPAYPADPAWAVTATYRPFDHPRPITLGSVLDGLEHEQFRAAGTLVLELAGTNHELTVLATGDPTTVQLLFTDATSGATTWRDARTLSVDVSGPVIVDFNRAVNLPCAYTDHATCPLPPAGNHLDVEVTAGEIIPNERK